VPTSPVNSKTRKVTPSGPAAAPAPPAAPRGQDKPGTKAPKSFSKQEQNLVQLSAPLKARTLEELSALAKQLRDEADGIEPAPASDPGTPPMPAAKPAGPRLSYQPRQFQPDPKAAKPWLTECGITLEDVKDANLLKTGAGAGLDTDHPFTRKYPHLEVESITRFKELGGKPTLEKVELDKLFKPTLEDAALVVRFHKAFGKPDQFHGKFIEHWKAEIDGENLQTSNADTVKFFDAAAALLSGTESKNTGKGEAAGEGRRAALGDIIEQTQQLRTQLMDEVLSLAQKAWEAGSEEPFSHALDAALAEALGTKLPRLFNTLAKAHPKLTEEVGILLQEGCGFPSFRAWLDAQQPDLAFGETIPPPTFQAALAIPADKQPLIDKLARLGKVGDASDLMLLKQTLSCIDAGLLGELAKAGYTLDVARDNVTNGQKNISGRKTGSGIVADHADGVHSVDKDGSRSITIRSFMRDGKLAFNVSTLMHEIGHAVDLVLRAAKDPLHVDAKFADAFAAEHKNFSRAYFHEQREFMAEFFALYAMDREQAARKFPRASAAFDTLKLPAKLVDGQALVELHESMVTRAPVTASPDPVKVLEEHHKINQARASQQKVLEPQVIELDGEPAATLAVAKELGSRWVTLRAPTVSPFGVNDGFVRVSAATFNDPNQLNAVLDDLTGSNGAVLYLDELDAINRGSPGFAVLKAFQQRSGDLCPLVLSGPGSERKAFRSELGAVLTKTVAIEPLTAEQIAELVRREVNNDGYELSEQAAAALLGRTRGGDYASAMELWRSIKQTQQDRKVGISDEIAEQPRTVGWVLQRDVDGAKVSTKRDAFAELDKMIGLGGVKTELQRLIGNQRVNLRREQLGLDAQQRRRLNLLFSGNPGTGKTTVAQLLSELALEYRLTKRSGVAIISATELAKGGPQKLFDLFRKNRDGVIFIDEFHQLADPNTEGGKAILNALIPLLTDKEYEDTIFIGAGYPDKLRLLMDVDPGLRRRFTDIPFDDYSTEELGLIGDKVLKDKGLWASDEVRATILQRVVSLQRSTKYPGNAGDVVKIVDEVADRMQSRLAGRADIDSMEARELQTIQVEDVVLPPKYTVDDVMGEIMDLEGLDEAKSRLWGLVGTVELNREQGLDPLTNVQPYFILEGPAGCGKTTLARLIGKLFYALDIIPADDIVEITGGKMVGAYIGNSSALAVEAACQSAWGKTLFVDEIGGATTSGDYSLQSAKEVLTQTLNYRGKFVMVLADYPVNVDRFLALDQGLPRRFPNRLRLESMTADGATRRLRKLLDARGIDYSAVDSQIEQRMPELAALAAWASGGDVGTLEEKLWTAQSAARIEARKQGKPFDLKTLSKEVFQRAFDELKVDIQRRPDPNRKADAFGQAFAYANQSQAATGKKDATATADPLSSEDHSLLATLGEVDQQFGAKFNDPAELARQEADPQSDYNKAVAAKLGVTPEEAKAVREAVKIKVKRLVEVMEAKEVKKFVYHCPYCGGINSPSCAYINYPMEWKLEKSLRKPWTETVYEKKKVEQVVEETVSGRVVDWT
jgi:SpoVK/Ycf46/Vps4 family AAA+-type ATPase